MRTTWWTAAFWVSGACVLAAACGDSFTSAPGDAGSTSATTSGGGQGQGGMTGGGGRHVGGAGGATTTAPGVGGATTTGPGTGGQGGSAVCSAPEPVGALGGNCSAGGTSAASGGASSCEVACDDQASQTYEVSCQGALCKCMFEGDTVCTCDWSGPTCLEHCCPAPWTDLTSGGSSSSSSGAVTSTGTSSSSAVGSVGSSVGSAVSSVVSSGSG